MKYLKIPFLLLTLLILSACYERLETIENQLYAIRSQLSSHEWALGALQAGRTISSFETDKENGGYILTFADGEAVLIPDGKTPVITVGENGNWFIDGKDSGKPSRGESGHSPETSIIDGYWFVDGVNTGVRAQANDGAAAPVIIAIMDYPAKMAFLFSDGNVIEIDKALATVNIRSDYAAGEVAPGEALTLGCNYIKKNVIITASVDKFPSSGKIRLSRGKDSDFVAGWIDVDASTVRLSKPGAGGSVVKEAQHGLSFVGPVDISADFGDTEYLITIVSGGESFELAGRSWFPGGECALKNLGEESFSGSVRFFPKDSSSKIWIIGDSYIDWLNPERWPYHVYSLGYSSWLADHLSGGGSGTMLECFRGDLQFGRPQYALWMMGMNDGGDSDAAPSDRWLSKVTEFISLCENNGITPVLSTVPSVPAINHAGKTRWVRESGYRYIDVAAAVQKDEAAGLWHEGFLEAAGIHPTTAGAKAIARKVLSDFPEITTKN